MPDFPDSMSDLERQILFGGAPPAPMTFNPSTMSPQIHPTEQAILVGFGLPPIDEGEDPITFLSRRALPVVSSILNTRAAMDYQSARERAAASQPLSDEDQRTIASYELQQRRDQERGVFGQIGSALTHVPSIIGEAALGGSYIRGIPAVAGLGAGGGLAARAGGLAVRTGIQTAAMPSMYLPQAGERAVQFGGSPFEPQNLGPAFAMGFAQTAILGSLSGSFGNVGGAGARGALMRVAARTGLGIAEQQAVDVGASLADEILPAYLQSQSRYGLLGSAYRGEWGEAGKHLAIQAATFAAFSVLHPLLHGQRAAEQPPSAPETTPERPRPISEPTQMPPFMRPPQERPQLPRPISEPTQRPPFMRPLPEQASQVLDSAQIAMRSMNESGLAKPAVADKLLKIGEVVRQAVLTNDGLTEPQGTALLKSLKVQGKAKEYTQTLINDAVKATEAKLALRPTEQAPVATAGQPERQAAASQPIKEAAIGGQRVPYQAGPPLPGPEAKVAPGRAGTGGAFAPLPAGQEGLIGAARPKGSRVKTGGENQLHPHEADAIERTLLTTQERRAIETDFTGNESRAALAKELGVTPQAVSYMRDRAFEKLKKTSPETFGDYASREEYRDSGRAAPVAALRTQEANVAGERVGGQLRSAEEQKDADLKWLANQHGISKEDAGVILSNPLVEQSHARIEELAASLRRIGAEEGRSAEAIRADEAAIVSSVDAALPASLEARQRQAGDLTAQQLRLKQLREANRNRESATPAGEPTPGPELPAGQQAEPVAQPVLSAEQRTKPPLSPMGGEHFEPGAATMSIEQALKEEKTALANALVDAELKKQGKPPLMSMAREDNAQAWRTTLETLKKDPSAGERLVTELAERSRTATKAEQSLLLHEKIKRDAEYGSAASDVIRARSEGADAVTLVPLEAREAEASTKYKQLLDVIRETGAQLGDSFQFRRQLAASDYSLAGMMTRAEAAKKSPLTAAEKNQIAELQTKLREAEEARLRAEEAVAKAGAGQGIRSPQMQEMWKAKLESQKLKDAFDDHIKTWQEANKPFIETFLDKLVKARQAAVISSPKTMAKIGAASAERIGIAPMEEVVGAGLSRLPLLNRIAELAPIHGKGFVGGTEKRAFISAFADGIKDAWQILKTGRSELDVLFGGKDRAPRSWLDWIGELHAAGKAPAVRAAFTRAFEHLYNAELAAGKDVTHPETLLRLGTAAYKESLRAKFQQENAVVDAYQAAIRKLISPNSSAGAQAIGRTAQILLPVVRIPTNLVAEVIEYTIGVPLGGLKAGNAFRKGLENLKPNEADVIMRQLKKGSLGMAALAMGYAMPGVFGGYYSGRRDESDVKVGGIRTPIGELPSWLLHNPLLEVFQLGATVRRAQNAMRRGEENGLASGIASGLLGLAEEVPFVREATEVGKLFDPRTRGHYFGELIKSLAVPQAVQWIATGTDKDAEGNPIHRETPDVLSHIQSGIPGARQALLDDTAVHEMRNRLSVLHEARQNWTQNPQNMGRAFPDEAEHHVLQTLNGHIHKLEDVINGRVRTPHGVIQLPPERRLPPERIAHMRETVARLAKLSVQIRERIRQQRQSQRLPT